MEKRSKQNLSSLTDEERHKRKREQENASKRRSRARKKATALGIVPPPKHFVNEGKTEEEIRQRKLDLDRFNRQNKTFEERENYLRKERERKRIARRTTKNIVLSSQDVMLELQKKYPDLNTRYLNRYIKLVYGCYSGYSKFEEHHILPKSIWPEYEFSASNKKLVPVKLHFLLHWILVKMIPNAHQMSQAFCLMCDKKNYKSHTYISRVYELAKAGKSKRLTDLHLERLKTGTNPFSNPNLNRDLIKRRRLPAQISADNGYHHWLKVQPWNHSQATEASRFLWSKADYFYDLYISSSFTRKLISFKSLESEYPNAFISRKVVFNIMKKIKNGWNPTEDHEWMSFKESRENK